MHIAIVFVCIKNFESIEFSLADLNNTPNYIKERK